MPAGKNDEGGTPTVHKFKLLSSVLGVAMEPTWNGKFWLLAPQVLRRWHVQRGHWRCLIADEFRSCKTGDPNHQLQSPIIQANV